MRRYSRQWAAVAVTAVLLTPTTPGVGQGLDCTRLRTQIATLGRGDPARASSYQRGVARQQAEIERTTAYSRQLGCDRQQFLFFGSPAPPQCGAITAQIARMQANLQVLQQSASQAGGGDDSYRRDLIQRYNSYCGAGAQTATASPPRERGFFEHLFGGDELPSPQQDIQQLPPEPERREAVPEQDEGGGESRGGSKAVCVRSCDGGFFPVSYSARSSNLDDLQELCHALCPNAEVNLFTYSVSREIETAVSLDGTSYRDLPNAFLYSKKFDPACTCRPAGKSWAETLVDAERMLGSVKSDVIVTQAKSDEMARPGLTSLKGRPARTAKIASPPKPDLPPPVDDPSAAEGTAAAQVATASKESAGITAGVVKSGTVYGVDQGVTKQMVGPDGTTRKVRIIAPTL